MAGTDPAAGGIGRLERLALVGSTNDIVRGWLAEGEPEVCVAVADGQTAGRGRAGRAWVAPPGAALLLSCGFRPTYLAADRAWRLGATVSLAMCDAGEEAAGLPEGSIRLKWPNDLVVELSGPHALLAGISSADEASTRLGGQLTVRKLAGVLGETEGLGTGDPRVVVGIGVNADWPASSFPPELAATMTSLREASGGRPIDRDGLLDSFLGHLEARLGALRAGYFDLATWMSRQALAGRLVRLEGHPAGDGAELLVEGLDAASGGLWVASPDGGDARLVLAGEVTRVRLAAGA